MEHVIGELVDQVLRIDDRTVEFVLTLRHPITTKLLTSVTGLGSASAGLVFLSLFYLAGWTEEFLQTLGALSLAGIVVGTLMTAVQRPFPPYPVCMTGGAETVAHSFPSGHAAAVATYTMTARHSETLPFEPVAVLAALIAFSRIYLGTHYLSDTVVGVVIGFLAFVTARTLLERLESTAVGRDALERLQ
ncbi:phosphatase PAP2 family protein [Natrinema ejinorense]|uniref:Glucose-6-phosphatase n=1 Tax=Natrinema ejinorense TaxID=373386 RepID=A0A2A5QS64_9EURY|nr:phosphatase PAP2 family protein [Natrinema ejinorense]PCR89603.1 glucose-6-phosphatase [Natrinema ejinorense]